jgi:hypothetical protein
MANEERELEDLLRIKKRRLLQLEKQVARLGYGATPELVNERDDLKQEIGASTKVIEPIVRGELPDDIMAALRAYGVPASVNNALQNFEARLYEWRKEFIEFRDQQSRLREKESEDRETRQQETDLQRAHVNMRLIRIELSMRWLGGFIVVSVVALVIYLAAR